jgi:hypothetical protein
MIGLFYIALTLLIIVLFVLGYYKTLGSIPDGGVLINRKMYLFSLPLAVWFTYLVIVEQNGILLNFNPPPKFPLLIFVPFFIFTIVFYFRKKNSAIIHAIPKRWPIFFQTFRVLVELLLLFTFYQGIIPELATFEGLNFDILMGLSAPFIGLWVYTKNKTRKRIAYSWNILGILMVLFVGFIIASSLYFPHIWDESAPSVQIEFLQFPYLLLPAFLAPMAIFMHVIALIQLRNIK